MIVVLTAVVGILNKHAVAIAADSAVTIGRGNDQKIFNKANKLFTLSKVHPVGIMIYNSAFFMSTPWEIIIKVYRKELGDNSFPTLNDYQQNFIRFLREKEFYTDNDTKLLFVESFIVEIVNSVIDDVVNQHPQLIRNPTDDNKLQFLVELEQEIDQLITDWNANTETCTEFIDYTIDMFETYSEKLFDRVKQQRFDSNGMKISTSLFSKIKQFTYLVLKAKEEYTNYTGLIFTGFGEDEIYPQLIPVNISFVLDDRLRFFVQSDKVASISNTMDGAVRPFAQTDVINTILTGIDPSLDNQYSNNFYALFEKYNQAILNSIGNSNPILSQQIKNLDKKAILEDFNASNLKIKQDKYISPLMSAVSSLSKEDLSEMAESLIYLTYLKRRITFTEESVGGPVDVAIISKGDGFVWIKRKQYFKPELNQHFFDNYFKR